MIVLLALPRVVPTLPVVVLALPTVVLVRRIRDSAADARLAASTSRTAGTSNIPFIPFCRPNARGPGCVDTDVAVAVRGIVGPDTGCFSSESAADTCRDDDVVASDDVTASDDVIASGGGDRRIGESRVGLGVFDRPSGEGTVRARVVASAVRKS